MKLAVLLQLRHSTMPGTTTVSKTGKHISPPRQTWRENLTLRVQQRNVKLGYRNPFSLEKETFITDVHKQI
jgi:hypothetical protein